MNTFLAIASRREVRDYRPDPIPPHLIARIVDAGRITGSAKNSQPWVFAVIKDRAKLNALADVVTRRTNLERAPLAVAIILEDSGKPFDAGRAAQSMMLAAWAEGIGSCPNTIKDPTTFRHITGIADGSPSTLLTFGYPVKRSRPERREPEEWLRRADRKPRSETVYEID